MIMTPIEIAPARVATVLRAAEAAARAIPPAFPLDATVAVNPFLGQTGEDLAKAAARLGRVAGVRLTRARAEFAARIAEGAVTDEDLAAALSASASPLKPADVEALKACLAGDSPTPAALPTVADLAASASGTDWPGVIARSIGLWAGGHFDRGQALWTPRPGRGAFAAWREWATHDLTPEIAGLSGFCAHVAEAPDTTGRAILRAADRLELTADAAQTVFHRLLVDLGGWSQHARWLLWRAELEGGSDTTPTDLLAIRLIWEEALLARFPEVAEAWRTVVAAHDRPVAPTADQVVDAILQEAVERAHQRRLAALLSGPVVRDGRADVQAVFCIDVRSEVLRRAFEAQHPGIETLGFAGFFGLPVAHRPHGTDEVQAHLPALLNPALVSTSHTDAPGEAAARIGARAARAWGRFRQAAVSSFAFVEAAGPAYGAKLLCEAVGLSGSDRKPAPMPRIEGNWSAEEKAATAATVLRAMGLTAGHARLVLLVGHGAQVRNNPHESAYHCGACCGQTGEVSARLLAGLLNDPQTRAGLAAHGLSLPDDTLFVAGLHDTVTDEVTLYEDAASPGHGPDLARTKAWLVAAGRIARAERARRLPGARAFSNLTESSGRQEIAPDSNTWSILSSTRRFNLVGESSEGDDLARRATDWAEVRPEWGLAGCAAFIAAPRAATAGRDLAGRAFLHTYDWKSDPQFGTLELILTAPVVVASWISLQYYGSTVAPRVFGGGNKLIHNVVGGIGVVEGNGGPLRPGLPLQTVHDGETAAHDPLRLSVMIEAPVEAITAVLRKHDAVRALFDNGWLHLFALAEGRVAARYVPGLHWERDGEAELAA